MSGTGISSLSTRQTTCLNKRNCSKKWVCIAAGGRGTEYSVPSTTEKGSGQYQTLGGFGGLGILEE